ncbi:PA2169 family four-helix-bundle protein [Maribellus comscasis]|uniref:PA2169 family four-helix-bundle protein n=1 Tax=Maribellus comscasis TaxID=2681766 RepID=A0A6I6K2Q4_9BACT|nr:PA2169 family four-helix-bundle protein [Maribellus comscasis]QGY47690.1 PA2169 family four-helix-bundle protein [Maribellus comscasis]
MEKKDVKNDIQEIIDICKDGAEGYETAANNIEYSDVKTLFLRLSQQRKLFIEEIKNEALKMGMELDTSGTIKGFFHRIWLATKATFSSATNEKVIEESMTGEKAAVETYDKVLADSELPAYLREILAEQQRLVKVTINQLSELKKEVS